MPQPAITTIQVNHADALLALARQLADHAIAGKPLLPVMDEIVRRRKLERAGR